MSPHPRRALALALAALACAAAAPADMPPTVAAPPAAARAVDVLPPAAALGFEMVSEEVVVGSGGWGGRGGWEAHTSESACVLCRPPTQIGRRLALSALWLVLGW